ncbi:MAG: lysylphosphatidylglycerol synthase transmembrane domain-containing protein [Desulfuromonadaceae bacterium]
MNRYSVSRGLIWLFSLVLVVWILKSLPLNTIIATLRGLSPWQWLAWAGVNVAILLIYVERWRCLTLAAGLDIDFSSLFMLRQAGQTISFITPGPQFGGEPFQVYWLWKKFSSSGPQALLCVMLDRFYELWINLALLLLGIVFLMLTPALGLTNWSALALIVALIVLGLSGSGWFIVLHQGKLSRWLRKLGQRWENHPRLKRIDAHWDELGERLRRVIRTRKSALALALLLAVLGWIGMIFEIWMLLHFFAIKPDFSALILIVVGMRLAFLLPLPGGVGTLEAAIFWCFAALGLPMAGAGAMIAMIRLRDALVLLIGQFALWRIGQVQTLENITPGQK